MLRTAYHLVWITASNDIDNYTAHQALREQIWDDCGFRAKYTLPEVGFDPATYANQKGRARTVRLFQELRCRPDVCELTKVIRHCYTKCSLALLT